jgi:hypothetical protein
LSLAKQAAEERKESKELRDVTETSSLLSAMRSLKEKTTGKKSTFQGTPKTKFKKFNKNQEQKQRVYFNEESLSGGRASTPSKPIYKKPWQAQNTQKQTKDQKQPFRGNKRGGGNAGQQQQY